jgi:hypothetical protein
MTTLHPLSARVTENTLPSPDGAPVIIATFPATSSISSFLVIPPSFSDKSITKFYQELDCCLPLSFTFFFFFFFFTKASKRVSDFQAN